MRADTQTISIDTPASQVFDFVADPANLPRWAIAFAKEVQADGDAWLVTTGDGGKVSLRPVTDEQLGVVDFHMVMPGGVESVARSRVVPRDGGSEFVFTQVQAPGIPEEMFDRFVETVAHELTALKAVMEVECPL
jgi:uncharacterized protein YndB with AHSA1/START domain